MRSVLGASTVAVILPMIDAYGAAVTYLLITLLIWISYGYVVVPKEKRVRRVVATHRTSALEMVG